MKRCSGRVWILSAWLVTGCADAPEAPAETPAPTPVGAEALLDAALQERSRTAWDESPRLDWSAHRDPFEPYGDAAIDTEGPTASPMRRSLDGYRLTAVVTGDGSPQALLEDTEGRGRIVEIGTRIGGHRVQKITTRGLTVVRPRARGRRHARVFIPLATSMEP